MAGTPFSADQYNGAQIVVSVPSPAAKGVGVVREWGEDADRASGCHAASWGAGLEGVGTGLEDFVDGDFYSEFCVGCTTGAEKVAATKYKAPAVGAGAGKIVEERITAKAENK